MADQFGVTADGFELKGIDRIVADQQSRAQAMFGADVDLTSGSALRKVLDAVAWDAHELWRGLEAQYYSNFVTTATGPSLDLLGTDLGMARQNLRAQGQVTLTLTNGAPGRSYALPEGTAIETAASPVLSFRTAGPVTLSSDQPVATVAVQAVASGPAGNLAAAQQLQLDAGWATLHLNLGTATVTPTNPQAFQRRRAGRGRCRLPVEAARRAAHDLDRGRPARAGPGGGWRPRRGHLRPARRRRRLAELLQHVLLRPARVLAAAPDRLALLLRHRGRPGTRLAVDYGRRQHTRRLRHADRHGQPVAARLHFRQHRPGK